VENIPEGVFTTDLERRILSWNPAAERILGWKEGEVTGKRCAEILHINLDGELVCETDCVLARIKEEKTTIEGFQAYFIAADGRQVPVLTSVSPIQNPD